MSFLLSANLFEDQWSFIILRDMLLLKRAAIKEFKSSREKIDDDTLSKTLRKLMWGGNCTYYQYFSLCNSQQFHEGEATVSR